MFRTRKDYMIVLSFVLGLVVILSSQAQADLFTYDFGRITSNAPQNIASQLSMDVTNDGLSDNQAAFIFYNAVGIPSELTEVYFDDGTLLDIASVTNSTAGLTDPTFSTSNPLNPPVLPGGDLLNPDFVVSQAFSVDSDVQGGSTPDYGLEEAADSVTILFTLQSGKTFADVIDAINLGFDYDDSDPYPASYDSYLQYWNDQSLRVGVHVRSIPDGQGSTTSDSFVVVPVPGAVILGLLGMGIVGLKLRKFA